MTRPLNSRYLNRAFSLEEVIANAMHFSPMTTQGKKLFHAYGEAAERGRAVFQDMQQLSKEFFHFDLYCPQVPAVAGYDGGTTTRDQMAANLQLFAKKLAVQWDHPRIGRIMWNGRKECVATFCDFERTRGVLNNNIAVLRSTHHIIDAKFHKLPAVHVEQPRRARRIAASLQLLYPHARIITGIEVGWTSACKTDPHRRGNWTHLVSV